MEAIEQKLRTEAKNLDNSARKVLSDYLEERGQLLAMPTLIEPFKKYLRPVSNGPEQRIVTWCQHLVLWNGWAMSIQGNQGAYCKPRENRPLEQYTHMEIAIFDPVGSWVRPFEPPYNHLFLGPMYRGKLLEYHTNDDVAGYVPVAVIQDVLWHLHCFTKESYET